MYSWRQSYAIRNIICSLDLYWYNMGGIDKIELRSRNRTAAPISLHNLLTKTRLARIAAYRFDDFLPLLSQKNYLLWLYILQLRSP